MNNYGFCAQRVVTEIGGPKLCVLDYDHGAGAIVRTLRSRGVDAYGRDVFYEGGEYSASVDETLIAEKPICRMEDGQILFEAGTFDLVVNNQVLKNAENLKQVLCEINRVLKPGGKVLSFYPDRGVLREGHCGTPFLHWFRTRSRFRVNFTAAFRNLGLGKHKGGKSVMAWSRNFREPLDNWTYCRSRREIHATNGRYFEDLRHIENPHFDRRCDGGSLVLLRHLPRLLKRPKVTRLATMVFVAVKRDASAA